MHYLVLLLPVQYVRSSSEYVAKVMFTTKMRKLGISLLLFFLASAVSAVIITSNGTSVVSEVLPIKYWEPRVGSSIEVILVPCNETSLYAVPVAGLCSYDPTNDYFENMLERATSYGFQAVILSQVKRWPGEGYMVTNGRTAEIQQLIVHEVAMPDFALLSPGMQVTLIVSRANPVRTYINSPYSIIWTVSYALFVLGAICLAGYLVGYYVLLYLSKLTNKPHVVVIVTLILQLIANILRFVDLMSLYNARVLYPTVLSDILFTAHLLPTMVSSLLVAQQFRIIYLAAIKIEDPGSGFLPDNKTIFYTFCVFLAVMEVFLKVSSKTFARSIPWWVFMSTGMYAMFNVFVLVWYSIWYYKLKRQAHLSATGKKAYRMRIIRTGALLVVIGCFGWLLTLIGVAGAIFTSDNIDTSLWASHTITYIGFFMVTLTSYGNLLILKPPKISLQSVSSKTTNVSKVRNSSVGASSSVSIGAKSEAQELASIEKSVSTDST